MSSLPLLAKDGVDDGKMAITMTEANKVEKMMAMIIIMMMIMTMMTVLGKWQ